VNETNTSNSSSNLIQQIIGIIKQLLRIQLNEWLLIIEGVAKFYSEE
jgi:hypothetical protein